MGKRIESFLDTLKKLDVWIKHRQELITDKIKPFIHCLLALYVVIVLIIPLTFGWNGIEHLIQFLQVIAFSWVTIGIIIYWLEKDNRRKQKQYQAWQAINLAQGKTGSGGRIQALEALNKDGVSLAGIDIAKAFLGEVDLRGADLREANLRKANLRGAKLQGANLQKANLQGITLQGAKLQGANLQGAHIQGIILRGPDNQRTRHKEIDLMKADLEVADLGKANLQEANLLGTYLFGAVLREANLQGANLRGTDLRRTDLSGANLQETILDGADLQESYLVNIKNITIEQLSKVKTLYKAALKLETKEQIKKNYPYLLEKSHNDTNYYYYPL